MLSVTLTKCLFQGVVYKTQKSHCEEQIDLTPTSYISGAAVSDNLYIMQKKKSQ